MLSAAHPSIAPANEPPRVAHALTIVTSVAFVTLVKLCVAHWFAENAEGFYFVAVGLVAWRIGARAAFVTLILCALAQIAFFISFGELSVSWFLEGTVACLVLARVEARARSSADEVRRVRESLERQVEERTRTLAAATELHRELFDASPVPMFVFDVESLHFLAANSAAATQYGYSHEELLELSLPSLKRPEDVSAAHALIRRDDGGLWSSEVKHVKRDGTEVDIEVTARRVMFGGRPARIAVMTDVTARKRLEEKARQSLKMEAVGELAGGIAHDFNNMLSIILGYTNMVLDDMTSVDPLWPALTEVKQAAERSAELTKQLLVFSRQQRREKQGFELNDLVRATSSVVRRLAGDKIKVTTRLTADTCMTYLDRAQVEQVIVTLVFNAREAMPNGGSLVIETRATDNQVTLAVTDDGVGMSDETKARIFATKTHGEGNELGLATIFGIAHQCGGALAIESALGRGTTIRLSFEKIAATKGTN